MTARIDALQPVERQVLRAAAVAGIRFHLPLVQSSRRLSSPRDRKDRAAPDETRVSRAGKAPSTFAHALLNQVEL
jgi:hypothetical protein